MHKRKEYVLLMKWENLRKNKCPKCNKDFANANRTQNSQGTVFFTHLCGFIIRESRMKEIIHEQVAQDIDKNHKPWRPEDEQPF